METIQCVKKEVKLSKKEIERFEKLEEKLHKSSSIEEIEVISIEHDELMLRILRDPLKAVNSVYSHGRIIIRLDNE